MAKARFKVGQRVIDLNGKLRRIVKVVRSVSYDLDGEPDLLYQPDEVRPLTARERGGRKA